MTTQNIELFKTLNDDVFNASNGHWNVIEIKNIAMSIIDYAKKHNNKCDMTINDFYNVVYSNKNKQIKYKNYYCKKHLYEIFEQLKTNVAIHTNKTNMRVILLQ